MRNTLKWLGVLLMISTCGLIGLGSMWVRQYQQLADDESEIVLSQDVSDLTYCTMDGVLLKMDLYFPKTAPHGRCWSTCMAEVLAAAINIQAVASSISLQ